MGTSIVLFRVFDIEVRVHWSFVLILVYGAFMYGAGPAGPLVGAAYGVLVIILLFVCVTLHEFGHALVAKYYKVRVGSITLLPIGGVANLERMPDKPMQEFLIALAGPLVNFALAALLLPLIILVVGMQVSAGTVQGGLWQVLRGTLAGAVQPGVSNLLVYLLATNVLLGLFNLLPAFPMDGGRILRALLAMTMPYVQATRTAVLVGRVFAVLMAIWGIMGGGIILMLIAFFIYVGGGAEREAVESRAVLRHATAGQALSHNAISLYASERLSRAVDLIMNSYQTDYAVLDLSGNFIGVLTRPRLVAALKSQGSDARVVDAMLRAEAVPVVTPATTLDQVWEKMATSASRVVAVKQQTQFLGIITLDDLSEVFNVLGAALAGGDRPTPPGEKPQPGEEQPAPGHAADV
ncbi:MAG: site-2 protease family protein [Caldilineaceae bacterium]|nr:site-2 protease family protein [Caldilineaceae bacterium]